MIEIVSPSTEIDFVGRRRIAAALSLLLIVAGLAAVPLRGIRAGIDFAGGTELQLRFEPGGGADEGRVRGVLEALGLQGASVIRFGAEDSHEFLVKLSGELAPAPGQADAADAEGEDEALLGATTPDARREFLARLEAALDEGVGPVAIERVEFVGPKVGAELRRDGLLAMTIAFALILVYIAFRFSMSFAPGAVVALVHDVLLTAGLWVILGLEFDLRVLAALLAIIGYSLNDTIIIYDRIRENMELHTKHDLRDVVNRSINQTLSRTLLTSGTTMIAVLALLLLGGPVIGPFALAMAIGIVIGTYSTVFIAAPMVIWIETRRTAT